MQKTNVGNHMIFLAKQDGEDALYTVFTYMCFRDLAAPKYAVVIVTYCWKVWKVYFIR